MSVMDVNYLNAHATSTNAIDLAEYSVFCYIFLKAWKSGQLTCHRDCGKDSLHTGRVKLLIQCVCMLKCGVREVQCNDKLTSICCP